jgi:hypothetical protein
MLLAAASLIAARRALPEALPPIPVR